MADEEYAYSDIFSTLTLIYVEDEEEVLTLVSNRLRKIFKNVIAVTTAEEALTYFKTEHIDLVLTDYYLPQMDGLDFAKEVLNIDKNMPIILLTGYADMQFLVDAINIGITQFVAKPIQFKLLRKALVSAVDRVVLENLKEKAKKQELEILQFREIYNGMQHDMAFRKELHIIKNDYYLKCISPNFNTEIDRKDWSIETHYKSLDTMSGDSYSCRKIDDNNSFVFILDAMGKGVSASVTSILATSFLNYFIDESIKNNDFNFDNHLKKFTLFMKDNLLDDEVLCAALVHLDYKNDIMRYATFSMPRICLEKADGTVVTLKSNNLPLMKVVQGNVIDSYDIKDVNKILMCSDGLLESEDPDGNIYSMFLEDDFANSPFLKVFEEKFEKKVKECTDDATAFFIRRPFGNMINHFTTSIDTKFDELDKLEAFLFSSLERLNIDVDDVDCFVSAYIEAVMNAYEHGNLKLNSDSKDSYIKDNIYEEELVKLEQTVDKKIAVRIICCKDNDSMYIIAGIRDEGDGYPQSAFKFAVDGSKKYSGRGIQVINYYVDSLMFSKDYKEIFLLKRLDKVLKI